MATLLEYKCPACGGALNFDSELQKMKCPYCDTEFEMEALEALDQELNQTQEDMTWQEQPQSQWQEEEQAQLRSYICNSCGGEIVTDDTTAATSCPYCDNPVVMSAHFAGSLRPDLVIPFKLDKEAAMAALKKHLSGKPLLPKLFKSENRIEKIQGVYVPFWLFDADADADIRYRATRVRSWSDSNYIYTRTSHYSIYRAGSLGFAGVPVDGSQKLDNTLMESIEPFDLSQAEAFQTAYLAGFVADKYDVTSEDSIQRANERIKTSTQNEFAKTVMGYSTVTPVNTAIHLENSKVRYALYPVWILNTKYQGKEYLFAMNGQTGKFVGDLPVDKKAFFAWWGGLTAAVGAVAFLVQWLASVL